MFADGNRLADTPVAPRRELAEADGSENCSEFSHTIFLSEVCEHGNAGARQLKTPMQIICGRDKGMEWARCRLKLKTQHWRGKPHFPPLSSGAVRMCQGGTELRNREDHRGEM